MKRIYAVLLISLFITSCTNQSEEHAAEPVSSPAANNVSPAPSQEAKDYSANSVHKDTFTLYGHEYTVYFFNDGDFDYTHFVILKDNKEFYDSQKSMLTFEGGYKAVEDQQSWVRGVEQNNKPTFLFELADNRPDPETLVLEETDNIMNVTVFDGVQGNFQDIDNDGVSEFLGFDYYGQMPLGPALTAAYEWINNEYEPNINLTTTYWESEKERREKEYQAHPSELTLDDLISAYMLLGQLNECLNQFPKFYEWAHEKNSEDKFVYNYEALIKNDPSYSTYYQDWMSKIKPLKK